MDGGGIDPRDLVAETAQTTFCAPGNAADDGDFAPGCEDRRIGEATLAGEEATERKVSFLRATTSPQGLCEHLKAGAIGSGFSGDDESAPAHASAVVLRIGWRAGCEITADGRWHSGAGADQQRKHEDG